MISMQDFLITPLDSLGISKKQVEEAIENFNRNEDDALPWPDDVPELKYTCLFENGEGLPLAVAITDGETLRIFNKENIVIAMNFRGGGERLRFGSDVARWLWDDANDEDNLTVQNINAQPRLSIKHLTFRVMARDTALSAPDTIGAIRYAQEELGEVCRVYNLINRPGDARNSRAKMSVADLHRELGDLWLMLDTALGQEDGAIFPDDFDQDFKAGDPLCNIQIATNNAINVTLAGTTARRRIAFLRHAQATICQYPGLDLSKSVTERLQAWAERI